MGQLNGQFFPPHDSLKQLSSFKSAARSMSSIYLDLDDQLALSRFHTFDKWQISNSDLPNGI